MTPGHTKQPQNNGSSGHKINGTRGREKTTPWGGGGMDGWMNGLVFWLLAHEHAHEHEHEQERSRTTANSHINHDRRCTAPSSEYRCMLRVLRGTAGSPSGPTSSSLNELLPVERACKTNRHPIKNGNQKRKTKTSQNRKRHPIKKAIERGKNQNESKQETPSNQKRQSTEEKTKRNPIKKCN